MGLGFLAVLPDTDPLLVLLPWAPVVVVVVVVVVIVYFGWFVCCFLAFSIWHNIVVKVHTCCTHSLSLSCFN